MVPFHVFAINVYKIGLTFTRTLSRDQRLDLLIAFLNEHPDLHDQSVCLFSQIHLYFLKTIYCNLNLGAFFKFLEYRACTDSGSTGH